MALEVMEVLDSAGIIQSDAASVVARLWRLLLDKAWNIQGSIEDKWASIELTLMDVGRRYVCVLCLCVCVCDFASDAEAQMG